MPSEPALRLDDTPQLCKQFRLQYEQARSAWVLLYPEGMVKLSASASEIMKRIDGKTTLGAIIRDLEAAFPGAALRQDVLDFIETAHARGWISGTP